MSIASAESSARGETREKNGEEEEEEEEEQEEDDLTKEKKKLKKLRSIRLLRAPSLKPQRRKSKSQPRFTTLLSSSSSSCYSSSSSSWTSNQSSPTSVSDSVSSPNYMKSTTCSEARKENFQKLAAKSSRRQTEMKKSCRRIGDFESGLNPNTSVSSKGKSISPGQKLGFVLQRKPSLKPVRKLTKTATFRSKKSLMVKNLERATCSSAMRDTKFPSCVHLQPGKDEAEKIASMKVCPYSYCSLHGLRHGSGPPLKRFVSMRRRVLKNQLSKKFESQAGTRSKRKKGGNKPTKMAVDNSCLETRIFAGDESEICRADSPIDEANQIEERNRKYIKKWHLVYKNVLREIVEKEENEERPPETHICAPSSDDSPTENSDELLKIKAIELVQEAIDEILLPEAAKTPPETENNEDSDKKSIKDEGMAAMKENRISSMVGNKSNKWSYLKKIILLKRFVKALEKVRNIDPRKPKYVSVEANPEAEKVHLKHKPHGKKNTEEWFLDFALRQVVSKLEPDQKRRVTLLVEAFESIIPTDSMNSPQAESCKIGDGISFRKISDIKSIFDKEQSNLVVQRKNEIAGKETEEEVNVDDGESTYREVPVNGKVLKVPKEIISRLSLELESGNSTGKDSTPISSMEEPKVAMHEQNEEIGHVDGNDLANDIKLDKRKNTGLWFLIYNHMVSTIAADEETVPVIEGASPENLESLPELETSACRKGDENGGENKNDEIGNGQNVELQSMEAIRLVEEAIDQILLPEPDRKSISSIDAEQVDQSKESDETGPQKSGETTMKLNKSMSQGMKNWNNLRRIMVMKRFIKAVEKVKKFNPRGPRFLPLTPEEEAEKVQLRHQNTEDRKNAEEWMLDHALQQAVAKLTPARKRRVALLVEAFETVGPNMGRW